MRRAKKTESAASPAHHLNSENERNIEEFAEIFIESMQEKYQNSEEPFEAYAQKLQAHLRSDESTFKRRLLHGYNALLEELHRK